MFNLAHKDPILNTMVASAKALLAAGEARKKYAADWRKIGEALKKMVNTQNPEVADKMEELCGLFNDVAVAEEALADDEIRNADDFRDIIERYGVLFRTNEAYLQAKLEDKRASEALSEALAKEEAEKSKPNYESNRPKLLAAVEKARGMKKAATEMYKEKTSALIDQRKRYTKFKVRKMIEGWTRYGNGLKKMCDAETDIFQRMKGCLNNMRKDDAVTHEAVDALEQQIEQHMENAPPAVPQVLANAVPPPMEEEE